MNVWLSSFLAWNIKFVCIIWYLIQWICPYIWVFDLVQYLVYIDTLPQVPGDKGDVVWEVPGVGVQRVQPRPELVRHQVQRHDLHPTRLNSKLQLQDCVFGRGDSQLHQQSWQWHWTLWWSRWWTGLIDLKQSFISKQE